jgi:hypothetical protein
MRDYETTDGRFVMLDGEHVRGTFPRHWGKPPDDLEERERWMRRNIAEGERRMDAGEVVEGQRPKTPKQALASLRQRQESPAFGNAARMRLVELLKRGPR